MQEIVDGVEIVDLNEGNREANGIEDDVEGVLVQSVDPNSVAADSGVREGQVIVEVNEIEISSVSEAMRARVQFQGSVLLLRVSSEEGVLAVRVKE